MTMEGQRLDPMSIRLTIAGREYRIGQRVMTPEGMATVTAFDPQAEYDIGVTLDSTGALVYTTWRYAEPVVDAPTPRERLGPSDAAELRRVAGELARLRELLKQPDVESHGRS
jgi:hypothetical protein